MWTGSVRSHVVRCYYDTEKQQYTHTFPHIEINPSSFNEGPDANPVMAKIIKEAMRLLQEDQKPNISTDAAEAPCHWLDAIPSSLLNDEAAVVNYLCMLVLIDFQHWAQVPLADTPVGEVVEGFTGFYAVVDREGGVDKQLLEEQKEAAPTLVRGSAAMLFLLKRAVEEHQILWYDIDYLLQFLAAPEDKTAPATTLHFTSGIEETLHFSRAHPTLEAVKEVLKPCFMGCQEDGVTPLWMPATEERIQLLLSLAATFRAKSTTFYDLLGNSQGKLFLMERTAPEEKPLIPSLIDLHYRYRDFVMLPDPRKEDVEEGVCCKPIPPFPILKLSQLTADSLHQTLPVYWVKQHRKAGGALLDQNPSTTLYPWLQDVRRRTAGGEVCSVFHDIERVAICCDYQIPKLLRAAGLLQYDTTLSHLVDTRRLLGRGSKEEVVIRAATLVACEVLAGKIAETYNTQAKQRGETHTVSVDKAYALLDPLLWLAGRTLKGCEHHLCHTIMY